MRIRTGTLAWVVAPGLLALAAPAAHGQGAGRFGQPPALPIKSQPINASFQEEAQPTGPDTGVSFLDSALPQTWLRLRFDSAARDRRPDRAEFFYAKSGLPGSPGLPLPERNVDYQEFSAYLEWAPNERFSTFVEVPVRALNPDFNDNHTGLGDVSSGVKWAFLRSEVFVTTFQFRTYVPTGAARRGLGTDHVRVEPSRPCWPTSAWRTG